MEKVKIGICDNEMLQVEYLERVVKEFLSKRKNINYQLIKTTNSKEFLRYISEYDIILLDIDFGEDEIDGIEMGEMLREVNKKAHIIHVTGFDERMRAIKNHYFHYVMKPTDEDELEVKFNEALEYLLDEVKTIEVPIKFGRLSITLKAINYIRFVQGKTVVRTSYKTYISTLTPLEVEMLFEKHNFSLCHKDYLVNITNIRRVKDDYIILMNDEKIPLACRRANKIKTQFNEWLFSQI